MFALIRLAAWLTGLVRPFLQPKETPMDIDVFAAPAPAQPPVTDKTVIANAVRARATAYSVAAADVKRAIAAAEAAGLEVVHDFDTGAIAGAHAVTRIFERLEHDL